MHKATLSGALCCTFNPTHTPPPIAMSRQRHQQHSGIQRALCMLICVMAWDGPIPVLHHHGAGHSSEWLAHHCEMWHSDSEVTGFHWHFARPRDLGGRFPKSDESNPFDDCVFSVMVQFECQRSVIPDAAIPSWLPILPHSAGRAQHHDLLNAASTRAGNRLPCDFENAQSNCVRLNIWLV